MGTEVCDRVLILPFAVSCAGGEASAEAAAPAKEPTVDDLDFWLTTSDAPAPVKTNAERACVHVCVCACTRDVLIVDQPAGTKEFPEDLTC